MRKSVLSLALLAIGCMLPPMPAQAQSNRTFISGAGSDANACTFVSPCRTAQRAHDMTNPGGEINVLDPAGYGSLTITKAISIQGHGWGEIGGAGGATAITINAGANDKISLRGLVLEGFGTGANGILFNTGLTLDVQDCLIRNFAVDGLDFNPHASSTLAMSNTRVLDNGQAGISVNPNGGANVVGVLNRVESNNQLAGLVVSGAGATGPISFTVTDSVFAHNNIGINADSASVASAPPVFILVRNSTSADNLTAGLVVFGKASVRFTRSTVTRNGTGLSAGGGGTLVSFGDNSVFDNTTNGAPTNLVGPV